MNHEGRATTTSAKRKENGLARVSRKGNRFVFSPRKFIVQPWYSAEEGEAGQTMLICPRFNPRMLIKSASKEIASQQKEEEKGVYKSRGALDQNSYHCWY
jgi:hypothetical protein